MQFTKDFVLEEFIISKSHPELIKNIHILDQYKWNLFKLCAIHLQNIRNHVQKPITITSGYRTPALNTAIKGAKLSQHLFGEAADFVIRDQNGLNSQEDMQEALVFIKSYLWPAVGDCIDYRNKAGDLLWIHISLPDPRCIQRFTTMYKDVE